MSPARKTTHTPTYSVFAVSYATEEIKTRVEQGEERIINSAQIKSEMLYSGPSEAKARDAFYRGIKKAMNDPFIYQVSIWRGGKIIARVNPER